MSACDEFEGLIAQSLYESLHEFDANRLNEHVANCASCANEITALKKIVESIPAGSVAMNADLRPAIEAQIRSNTGRRLFGRRLGLISMAALLLIAVPVGYIQFTAVDSNSSSDSQMTATLAAHPAQFTRLMEQDEFARAFVWLNEAMTTNPQTFETSENRIALARLAFDELKWYPEAYEAYSLMRSTFPESFRNSGEDIRRFALLDEARVIDERFTLLHEWDRVQLDGRAGTYGEYIQHYPGTLHASEAVEQMARLIAEKSFVDNADENAFEAAMELALAQEENPIILAQFKLELGRYYWNEANQPEKARTLLEEVEAGPVTVLARAAELSLSGLRAQ
ncbi:MAG: hypothetical protein VCD00_15045 [Candidatus Hydrogenedentota bacterium]